MEVGKRVVLDVKPGTEPSPDATDTETLRWTATRRVNFYNGKPRSEAGWVDVDYSGVDLSGAARTLYGYIGDNKERRAIGTHTRLYIYQDSTMYNMTPLVEIGDAVTLSNNPIRTRYDNTQTTPIGTTNGTARVRILTFLNTLLSVGDAITVSGSGDVNGIPAAEINTTHIVREFSGGNPVVYVTSLANATSFPAQVGVVITIKKIKVTDTAHGFLVGDRIELAGSAAVGGVGTGDINKQHIIVDVIDADNYHVEVETTATSLVQGGGASVTRQAQVDAGASDTSIGFGYGGGKYGVGLYGVGKTFTDVFTYARIWSMDRFGQDLIACAGGNTDIYIWENDTDEAPVILTDAPTANWIFVSNNSVCALGADGVGNRIKISAPGDGTDWTTGAGLLPYEDDVEGAGTFISQARSINLDLLFTENEAFILRRPGLPDIWEITELTTTDGLIGPRARISIDESVFWVGQHDFYMFDGASLKKLLNNTVRDYVYGDMNYSQRWKFFIRPVPRYNQWWFCYCSSGSDEPDRVVKVDYVNWTYTVDVLARTAAEEPTSLDVSPYTVYSDADSNPGELFRHHVGVNDSDSAMAPYMETNYAAIGDGDTNMEILEFIPDFTLEGNVIMTVYTKENPQPNDDSDIRTFGPFTITPTTQKVDVMAEGKYRKYRFEQEDTDESFVMGKCYEVVQPGTTI